MGVTDQHRTDTNRTCTSGLHLYGCWYRQPYASIVAHPGLDGLDLEVWAADTGAFDERTSVMRENLECMPCHLAHIIDLVVRAG